MCYDAPFTNVDFPVDYSRPTGALRMLRQNQHRILKISLKGGYLCTNKFLCPVSFLDFTAFSVS